MKAEKNDADGQLQNRCNVNSTFNFIIGGLAIAAAVVMSILVYVYW